MSASKPTPVGLALAVLLSACVTTSCGRLHSRVQRAPATSTLVRFGPRASSSCTIPDLHPEDIRDLRWDQVSRHIYALRSEPDGVKLSVYDEHGGPIVETLFANGALVDSRLARFDGAVAFTIGYLKPTEHEELISVDQVGSPTTRIAIPPGQTAEEYFNLTEYHHRQDLLKEIKPPVRVLTPRESGAAPNGIIGEPSTDFDRQASAFPTLFGSAIHGPLVFRVPGYEVAGGSFSMYVARRMGGRWTTAEFGDEINKALHWAPGEMFEVTGCSIEGDTVYFGFAPISNESSGHIAEVVWQGQFKLGEIKDGYFAAPLEDVHRGGRLGSR